jgi:cell division protein ZapA
MAQPVNGKPATQPDRSMTLDVTILGREFKVACRESERTELMEAVALLDRRMRDIRDGGKVNGMDRIAMMAALNIAHDLLRARRAHVEPSVSVGDTPIDGDSARRRIQAMQAVIDQAMAGQEKLF